MSSPPGNPRERVIQSSEMALNHAMDVFRRWGAKNLVKVKNPGPVEQAVGGYITLIQTVADKTPAEISRMLGLREQDLAMGAMLYTLDRIPMAGEFEVRGYTTLPDGLALPSGQTRDAGGYRVGTGALQYVLTQPIPATLLGELRPGERANILRMRAASSTNQDRMSGAAWFRANQARFPNSSSITDLAPAFGAAVRSFIDALYDAGATVQVSSTRRNPNRAYLMHYSWQLAKGAILPKDIPANSAVGIIWDHGDIRRSRQAAQEMVDAFGIVFKPSLTSNHIRGTAIDMNINWSREISLKDAKGKAHLIDRPRNAARNTTLHAVGATYGVKKLLTDAPHWSANGR